MLIVKSYNKQTEEVKYLGTYSLEEDSIEVVNDYEEYLNKCGIEYVIENCIFLEGTKIVNGILFTLNDFVELK